MPGNRCIVSFCNSAYKNKQKKHFFIVPKDTELLQKWKIAIPTKNNVIEPGQVVCEDHFHETQIIRKKVFLDNNGAILAESTYNRPRLEVGAVPSVFPEYLSKEQKTINNHAAKIKCRLEHPEIVKKELVEVKIEYENNEKNGSPIIKFEHEAPSLLCTVETPPEEEQVFDNSSIIQSGLKDSSDTYNGLTFCKIHEDAINLCLPKGWSQHLIEDKLIMFHCFKITTINKIVKPFLLKRVWVTNDLKVYCEVMDKIMDTFELSYVAQLQEIITYVDNLSACRGCEVRDVPEAETLCTQNSYLDSQGRLRHKSCSIVMERRNISCEECLRALRNMKKKVTRLKKHPGPPKRVRLNLDPTQKKELRKKLKALRQRARRALKRSNRLNN